MTHAPLQQLVEHLEARLHTTQVIAEIILENTALREGVPGPYLDGYREGALMDAVLHLLRSNHADFCRLVELAGLPAGRLTPTLSRQRERELSVRNG